jgi:hypothetical protein
MHHKVSAGSVHKGEYDFTEAPAVIAEVKLTHPRRSNSPWARMAAFFRAVEMLTQEQAVEIKVLERQGRSIRQIMRETAVA